MQAPARGVTQRGGGGRGRDQRRQELLGLHAAGEGLLAAVAVAVPLPGVARAAQDAHHAADITDIVDIKYHYHYGLRITSCIPTHIEQVCLTLG